MGDPLSEFVNARRAKAATAWNLGDEVVLVGSGDPIHIPGGHDQCFEWRVHPDYKWLTERKRPGSVLAFDPQDGWSLFETPVTERETVWEGTPEKPLEGRPISELKDWLQKRTGRKVGHCGALPPGVEADSDFSKELQATLLHARRSKDASEIERMRRCAVATAAGYKRLSELIRPGVSERELTIEMEAAFFRAGADRTGYASIVGIGPNSAVFHFTPGARVAKADDVILVDAGGEVDGYVIDVTRTYPVSGSFDSERKVIYEAVKRALLECSSMCVAGQEWLGIHDRAAKVMLEGLNDLGFFKASADAVLEAHAMALFFPHGVGHMVGLGVRDAGGAFPGRTREPMTQGVNVRVDIPLDDGYVMTVEPGLYFIPELLNQPAMRDKFEAVVNFDRVDQWLATHGKCGFRLEDNVHVTSSGPEVLTDLILK